MSVPECERSKPKLEAIVKAMDLASYTIKITSNENVFKPQFQTALTDDIVHVARSIYSNAWKANNINVSKNPNLKDERKRFQVLAVAECYELLSLIQLAKPVFHLTSKRIRFWGYKTIKCRLLLQAWKDSDSKRYNY